ncbi:hypothetical protein H6G89_15485 [Oscillatoria sp. FACHB-1407]|uniref:hypothetical protein n=1 Tax=Oscillatoria sp. FACHB-1407 TaxID=2692847 RepID=UPI001689B3EF|nr:hypothetical protein [Oscillatoria sp. FACHB-1407]MBD2462449.1 hypothetical protein [Oscillatoria sp. FACHB-1407]
MDRLTQLRHQYLELTNHVLPNLATSRHFPIRENHCFQRIILDNLFGCCWYDVLERTREAAYKQLTEEQLEEAIALANAIMTQSDSYLEQLNQNSLTWRGKQGKKGLLER